MGDGPLRCCSGCPWPGCWPAARSRAGGWCGRCARCRWCCRPSWPAWRCSRLRPARHRRPVPRPVVRHHAAVHHRRGRRGPDLRGHALPRHHRRGRPSASSTPATRTRPAPWARSRWYVFRGSRSRPSDRALVAGAVLAWARALGEFGATITFAGNFPAAPRPCRSPSTSPTRPTRRGDRAQPRADRGLLRRALRTPRPLPERRPAARMSLDARSGSGAAPSSSTPSCTGAGRGGGPARAERRRQDDVPPLPCPACCRSTTAASSWTARCLDDPAPTCSSHPSGERWPSSSRTTCCSPTSPCSRTWRSGCGRGAAPSGGEASGRGVARSGRAADRPRPAARALSGGQAQRVALARALATEPEAAAARRAAGRARRAGADRASAATSAATSTRSTGHCLLVTHDPVDAYALADRVVVLEAGRDRADRHAADVTARPGPLRRRPGRREPAARYRPGHGAGDSTAAGRSSPPADASGPVLAAVIARPQVAVSRQHPEGTGAEHLARGRSAQSTSWATASGSASTGPQRRPRSPPRYRPARSMN